MIKTAAIALLFGFIGAALFGRLFPPASPYDYVAVINFMDDKGQPLGEAQSRLVLARAEKLSEAGILCSMPQPFIATLRGSRSPDHQHSAIAVGE